MVYAYIQSNVVLSVERRTEKYTDEPYPIQRFYHPSLLPFFKEVPNDIKHTIQKGWIYTEKDGFHEPKPFEINSETGEMYLPSSISAEQFYSIFEENINLKNQLVEISDILDAVLIEQLTKEGMIVHG